MHQDFPGTHRFQVLTRLGQGAMGIVYSAYDRERKQRVAVKTLLVSDARSLLFFKTEFRLLQDLRHPNLVRLGELFEEQGRLFFTMEWVDGEPFLHYVKPLTDGMPRGGEVDATATALHSGLSDAEGTTHHTGSRLLPTVTVASNPIGTDDPTRPTSPTSDLSSSSPYSTSPRLTSPPIRQKGYACDEPRLRAALGQLCQALAYVHAADKVHRDVKPSEVARSVYRRKVGDAGGLRTCCGWLDSGPRAPDGFLHGSTRSRLCPSESLSG